VERNPNEKGEHNEEQKYNNNNSIQFCIIYVPSQQPQGQLQTQHSVGTTIIIIIIIIMMMMMMMMMVMLQ
jgi:hypothetical protein